MQNEQTPAKGPTRPHLQHKAQLTKKVASLQDLCKKLNPYKPLSDEQIELLAQFDILELEDPFKVTNLLLGQLEDAITELSNLQN